MDYSELRRVLHPRSLLVIGFAFLLPSHARAQESASIVNLRLGMSVVSPLCSTGCQSVTTAGPSLDIGRFVRPGLGLLLTTSLRMVIGGDADGSAVDSQLAARFYFPDHWWMQLGAGVARLAVEPDIQVLDAAWGPTISLSLGGPQFRRKTKPLGAVVSFSYTHTPSDSANDIWSVVLSFGGV